LDDKSKQLDALEYMNDKKVFISGISGFVGSHLAELLLEHGAIVGGLYRYKSKDNLQNIENILEEISLYEGDILDFNRLRKIFEDFQPGFVFHLAAMSYVPQSFKSPNEIAMINGMGTINMLEAARLCDIENFHYASTSEVYGNIKTNSEEINEDDPTEPVSPYGASKLIGDIWARTYYKCFKLPTVVTRAFNHEGPRRSEHFVTSVIAKQVADIYNGKTDKLYIGNLWAKKDFSDVRDIIRGYILVSVYGKKGEVYNMGSGRCVSIQDLIDLTVKSVENELGPIGKFDIVVKSDRMRPTDIKTLRCGISKISKLGWRPSIPLEKTLFDMVKYYMNI